MFSLGSDLPSLLLETGAEKRRLWPDFWLLSRRYPGTSLPLASSCDILFPAFVHPLPIIPDRVF